MQTLKSFFASHEEPVGSFAEKNLKIIKKNIQNNILKSNKYVESVGKIKSYKKLLMFLINLFASENFLEDFNLFEENFLKDNTTLLAAVGFDVKGSTKITVETRACDYALAICVKLSGQSFQDYGFDILGPHSQVSESWIYAGFTKDETRKAALKKYAEWRKANPIKKYEPK